MKRVLLLIYMLGGIFSLLSAQINALFTHYSTEDGLSQNTVMDILQDREGNMWFSTWDGLNKFDGYEFHTYKAQPKGGIPLTHNRIDQLCEDSEGYLWVLTYDNHVCRLDPRTDSLLQVPSPEEESYAMPVSAIRVLEGGTVWLLSEKDGAIRIQAGEGGREVATAWYSPRHPRFPIERVYGIFEDSRHGEWLLTSHGLGVLTSGARELHTYFAGQGKAGSAARQAFYAAVEMEGRLFFGSDDGRVWCCDEEGAEFTLLQLPVISPVVALQRFDNECLLIATETEGFFVYRPATGEIEERYAASLLPPAPVRSLYTDRRGEVWFEQEIPGTVAHFHPQTRQVKVEHVRVESTHTARSYPAFHIHEDVEGRVWVHPYGGGFSYYDEAAGVLRPFFNGLDSPDWRFSNKIHATFSDRQGNLWLSTHSKGLEKVTFHKLQFDLESPVPDCPYETLGNEVRALCMDSGGRLWMGTKDGKLWVYGPGYKRLGYLTAEGAVASAGTPLYGTVYGVMEDSRGTLWISTKGAGIVKAESVGGSLHYRLTRYRYRRDDIYSLSNDDVYASYEDRHGRIWIATFAGGVNYLTTDESGRELFINYRNHLKNYPINECYKSRCITGDGQGNIWIGTTVGALRVSDDFRTPGEARFLHYEQLPGETGGLAANDVISILATRAGELYMATFGGGLSRLVSLDANGRATFRSYSVQDGLPSDVLQSLCEDQRGNLWMSSDNSLSKFIPGEERFENYSCQKDFPHIRFCEAAQTDGSDGRLLFGTSLGVLSFQADSLTKSRYAPPLTMTYVPTGLPDGYAGRHTLPEGGHSLTLGPKNRSFTLQYAALDYRDPQSIRYAYMLEGFEQSWNDAGQRRTVTYTNLPPGRYLFKVRSTNAEGVWTDNVRTLLVVVKPSFWETPWAYLTYVLLLLLLIVVSVYVLFTIYRLRHKVEVEHEVADMKLRFFTDISHELRTPLTLISGPVEYVLQQPGLSADARRQLEVVERNTRRMLRLVGQILDFRKIQSKKMKLMVQRLDVVAFTRQVMHDFDSMAEQRRINFLLESESREIQLYLDADKYEKIMYNLISNAFKYTPDGRTVTVFIQEEESHVLIGVRDTGIGIPADKRGSIFLRFENLVDRKFFTSASTGIGLSLVKELVAMHRATIRVESQEGEGSCFTLRFLKGKEHYDSSVEFLQDDGSVSLLPAEEEEVPRESGEEGSATPAQTMLLVEDNAELRLFLHTVFAPEYHIVEATDGVEGWEKALQLLPDIIVCDIMMPRKDGLQLTHDLRKEVTTSHIPIVLLTAKTSLDDKLRGLEQGADDYITKPFSALYLQARVRNLLERRTMLQERYRAHLLERDAQAATSRQDVSPMESMSAADRQFMERLQGLMERQMDNADLQVEDLAVELAVSRSVLFKKLKSLTGLAPVEFIRQVRIYHAAQLIEQGDHNMMQISCMVGINDSRYFSKCFKQLMGMTPTEYKEMKKRLR